MKSPRYPDTIKESSKPSNFCPGCGHSIILKNLGQLMADMKIEKKTVFAIDIGCSLLAWDYYDVDTFQTHHGRTTSTAVGMKMANPDAIIVAYMGDGGGLAIGLQNLIYACHRNDNITVILVNNTVFSMTGGQMAPTTMPHEVTNTTPNGAFAPEKPFLGPEMLAHEAHEGAYIARAAVSNPGQAYSYMKNAIQNQIDGKGFSFVEILSYCPIIWKTDAKETIKFMEEIKKTFLVGEIKKPNK
ncbi:MAG: thiamine pyrophosphate-dependent enzyme [Patescibacteria group bacterium]